HVSARLVYSSAGSESGLFETDGEANIAVGAPVVGLIVNAPSTVFSGENFDITVGYVNNSPHQADGAKIQMQFPPNFVFQRSNLPPASVGSNTWNLGALPPNASGTFVITGSLIGEDKALYTITGSALINVQGQAYVVSKPAANLAIATSPLSITATANGSANYIAHVPDVLQYVFTYTNNSNVTFQNVQIVASLAGSM